MGEIERELLSTSNYFRTLRQDYIYYGDDNYHTYEEVLESGLLKALKLIE